MFVSIVIPVLDERENIQPLFHRISQVMEAQGHKFEILFVDDGSTDGTFEEARSIARHHPAVRVIRLRRNFGQTAALSAGIDAAQGEVIVTMDGDLQNDPADIPLLISRIDEGFDLAAGWRHRRKDSYWRRTLPSIVANRLIAVATGVHLHDNGCTLKAFSRDIIKNMTLADDMHRYIPALASLYGARIAEVRVRHHPRRFGKSKYGISRTLGVAMDLLLLKVLGVISHKPHFFLYWGLFFSVPVFALLCVFFLGALPAEPLQIWSMVGIFGLLVPLVFFFIMLALLCDLIIDLSESDLETFRVMSVDRTFSGGADG